MKKSKLQLGFEKQCKRQQAKPRDVKIKLPPHPNLPKNFKGTYKHHIKVHNSIWNGLNLYNLTRQFTPHIVGGMYGKFTINADGKYKLSMYGKELLRKRKQSPSNV